MSNKLEKAVLISLLLGVIIGAFSWPVSYFSYIVAIGIVSVSFGLLILSLILAIILIWVD